jgi:hypothetical protein
MAERNSLEMDTCEPSQRESRELTLTTQNEATSVKDRDLNSIFLIAVLRCGSINLDFYQKAINKSQSTVPMENQDQNPD